MTAAQGSEALPVGTLLNVCVNAVRLTGNVGSITAAQGSDIDSWYLVQCFCDAVDLRGNVGSMTAAQGSEALTAGTLFNVRATRLH